MGCSAGQGFHLAHPLAPAMIGRMLAGLQKEQVAPAPHEIRSTAFLH
jgi:hypothetical protein